jgi:hypothetical protein
MYSSDSLPYRGFTASLILPKTRGGVWDEGPLAEILVNEALCQAGSEGLWHTGS